MQVEQFTTEEASPARLAEIRRLLDAAFGAEFTEHDWQHALGGRHFVAIKDGAIAAHAAVVDRAIWVSDGSRAAGYVEAVATHPDHEGEGFGSRVMVAASDHIRQNFEMGALSTGLPHFFRPFGWERWQGPSYVRAGAARIRTPDEDAGIMVIRVDEDIDGSDAVACEARPGDDW